MYEALYEMYEKDKVPPVHHLPKIEVEEWRTPDTIVRTEEKKDVWNLFFRDGEGETRLSIRFPTLGGVRITGERAGFFTCDSFPIEYGEDHGARVAYTKGGVSARLIEKNGFYLELRCGDKVFFTLNGKTISYGLAGGAVKRVCFTLPLGKEEKISGFGEKYNALNQVGKLLPLHNDDTGYHGHPEAGEKCRSYKNVPIFHSSNGYTFFHNSFYSAAADLTQEKNTSFRFDFFGPVLDAFIWCGSVHETLKSYTALTGRPVLPPKWAFEFWAGGGGSDWKKNGEENAGKVFEEAVNGYERMGTIPSAFYGESYPSRHKECYDMVRRIGSRMLAWNHPGVDVYIESYSADRIRQIFPGIKDEDIPMFHDAETGELLDKRLFYIDYSHPFALELMRSKYAEFKQLGLKGAMVDFGEFVEPTVRACNGMTGDEMHNFYGYCYSKTLHDAWEEISPGDYILFARAACAGTQGFICFFGGDQAGKFFGLRQAFYGGLNAALSGFTIWGSDIGSLSQCDSGELYLRWLQFGTFSPLMRLHGNHNPWNYGEHCEEVFKTYFWARKNLVDYIYSAVITSHVSGKPIMQMMSAYDPEDKRLLDADDQYMFGESLLVCPVLYEGMTERNAVLPEGEWVELDNKKRFAGGGTVSVSAPVEVCPVFLKAGAVVPVTVSENLALAEPFEKGVSALLFAPGEGETLHRTSETEAYAFTAKREGGACVLENKDAYPAKALLVIGEVSCVLEDGQPRPFKQENGIAAVSFTNTNWKEIRIS